MARCCIIALKSVIVQQNMVVMTCLWRGFWRWHPHHLRRKVHSLNQEQIKSNSLVIYSSLFYDASDSGDSLRLNFQVTILKARSSLPHALVRKGRESNLSGRRPQRSAVNSNIWGGTLGSRTRSMVLDPM